MSVDPLVVEPDVDAYGSRTRFETLADILEVAALGSSRLTTRADLADYVRDRGWLRKEYDLYSQALSSGRESSAEEESLGAETDRAHGVAEGVFEVLKDRERHYAERYPFEMERGHLSLRSSLGLPHKRYLALLAATFLHGHQVETQAEPASKTVELIVEAALRGAGLSAAGFGTGSRDGRGFERALAEAAKALRLEAHAQGTVRSKKIQDAGNDVIGRLDFGDDGYGKWIFIGQTTCGASETWPKKAMEPSRSRWQKLLGLSSWPVRFLAVPHEIPQVYRLEICTQADHSVFLLDRRRLAFPERQLLPAEEKLVSELRRVRLEGFS